MTNESVINQLAALPDMSIPDLKAMWGNLFEAPPQSSNKDFLIRKIAWRIQELAYGGLPDETRQRLRELRKKAEIYNSKRRNLPPEGTILTREHDGEEHRVLVLFDGFEYRGCKYRSLTEVAKKITGTKWSGPRFFGLKH